MDQQLETKLHQVLRQHKLSLKKREAVLADIKEILKAEEDNNCHFCHRDTHPTNLMNICDGCAQSMP